MQKYYELVKVEYGKARDEKASTYHEYGYPDLNTYLIKRSLSKEDILNFCEKNDVDLTPKGSFENHFEIYERKLPEMLEDVALLNKLENR